MTPRDDKPPDLTPLVVEIVCPHYLFSLLIGTAGVCDSRTGDGEPSTWIGGEVTMHHEPVGPYLCDFHGVENTFGDWLICLHDENDRMILRTHIESVRKIVVL